MCNNNKIDFLCLSVVILIIAIVLGIYFLLPPVASYSDVGKCPYCYGNTMCPSFEDKEIHIKFLSLINVINYKNIYYGEYNNVNVIVKKLASNEELVQFNKLVCYENYLADDCDLNLIGDQQNYTKKIINHMTSNINEYQPFKVCSKPAAEFLFDQFLKMKPIEQDEDDYLKHIWTILKINIEPLILQLLNSDDEKWPVPKYYGSCGRLAVVENRGSPLLDKINEPWMDRAYLALQLLQAGKNFTFDHRQLRFYLTDVSPDNIVVDDSLKLTFIDLENMVVIHEKTSTNTLHKNHIIHDMDGFPFSQEDLCSHILSDHNYYAICKLLLSRNAPYPMVQNGLLHSPPVQIVYNHQRLFNLIEECASVNESIANRFESGLEMMEILNEILLIETNEKNLI